MWGRDRRDLRIVHIPKLYYPEPDSAKVIALIEGKPVCRTPLHEVEFANALQLKVFFKSATADQVAAARGLVEVDLKAGVLVDSGGDWLDIFQEAVKLADQFTGGFRVPIIGHLALRGGKDTASGRIHKH